MLSPSPPLLGRRGTLNAHGKARTQAARTCADVAALLTFKDLRNKMKQVFKN